MSRAQTARATVNQYTLLLDVLRALLVENNTYFALEPAGCFLRVDVADAVENRRQCEQEACRDGVIPLPQIVLEPCRNLAAQCERKLDQAYSIPTMHSACTRAALCPPVLR